MRLAKGIRGEAPGANLRLRTSRAKWKVFGTFSPGKARGVEVFQILLAQECLLFVRDGPNTVDTRAEYNRILACKDSMALEGETVMESTT